MQTNTNAESFTLSMLKKNLSCVIYLMYATVDKEIERGVINLQLRTGHFSSDFDGARRYIRYSYETLTPSAIYR